MHHRVVATALVILISSTAGLPAAEPVPPVGTRVADFSLPEPAANKKWSLGENARDKNAVVLLFTSTSCPVCTSYAPRLVELAKQHGDKVAWVAIASHPADDAETLAEFAKESKYPFPIVHDDGGSLAAKLQVERVPTVLVLDGALTVRYAGRIDDQFAPGVPKAKASTAELSDALDAVLKGEEVKVSHAVAAGCLLMSANPKPAAPLAADPVTYYKHAAPILQAKCQECHRPGEAGPFALMTYRNAKDWAGMMREVVADGTMPPWHADAPLGHFTNDRRLTPDDKKTLLAWIDQGCAVGDPKDAPPPRTFTDGWRLGRQPDAVLRMNEAFQVPAHGTVEYQYVPVGDPFAEDRWITGIEVRPEHRAVVHHIIAYILPPKGNLLQILTPEFGNYMLGAYVPGDQPLVAGPGQARKIVKGSQVILEVHYTPNGRAVADRSCIGLCYAKEPPATELFCMAALNFRFRIPAGAADHEVKSAFTFKKDSTILCLAPHMHVRGKSFRYELVSPDGRRETILNVPRYDFNWQATYTLATPLHIPAGSRVECTARFDNSARNPFNPDPTREIGFGNMTTDEMMIGFGMWHEGK